MWARPMETESNGRRDHIRKSCLETKMSCCEDWEFFAYGGREWDGGEYAGAPLSK